MLALVAHRAGMPFRDIGGLGKHVMLVAYRLSQRQRQARGELGDVFAEHEHRIAGFHIAQRRQPAGVFLQQREGGQAGMAFGCAHAVVEVVGADQMPQREVVFQRGPRRTDTDQTLGLGQHALERGEHDVHVLGLEHAVVGTYQRLTRTVFAVDEAGAETAAIAEEIVVDLAVKTVLDALEHALTRTGAGVAAQRAMGADAGGILHVPFTVVVGAQRLVGEHAGGADLHQVARELAVEGAVGFAAEIDVRMRAEHAQIVAVGIVAVVAHAAIAGDTAVHLVIDERAKVLITMGTLGPAIAAARMPGHQGHVLQMAFAAFFAYRAVMRMVDHQPFDDLGTEIAGFLVCDREAAAVRGRRHAGHDDLALGIVFVLVLLDRALATGAHGMQLRVPAEIGQVEALGKRDLEQVVGGVHLELLAVDLDRCHR